MATIEEYRKQLNNLQNQKNNIANNSLSDVEKTALDSKIANTQSLINNYVDSANALQSSKAEAYSAKQRAINNANNILGISGYGTQGMAQTTMANVNNAYANQIASANAQYNSNNANYFKEYQDQLNEIEQDKYTNQSNVQANNYNTLVSEMETILPTHLTDETITKYRDMVNSMNETGELSNTQKDQLNTILDGYVEQASLTSQGIDAEQGVVNLGSYVGQFKTESGTQNSALTYLQNNVQKYVDAGKIKDGTVIDINFGKGAEYIIYKNGQFYRYNGKPKGAIDLNKLYKMRNSI